MNKIYFNLVVHNHQPVGNFEHIFEDHYNKCYKPFLDTLEKYPQIKTTLHWSGCLLEWLKEKHFECFDKILLLVEKKQIEILSGGFYEPIFSAIPKYDALEQIKFMNKYIKKHFNFDAEGLWLPERVWEPSMPSLLAESGIKYTLLDDTHFYWAGLSEDKIFDYYLTEDDGKIIYIFPISKKLRYIIPFSLPENTIHYFEELLQKYGGLGITLGDDGEKFGGWPGTYKWVWEEKYLERLFELLIKREDIVETLTLQEFKSKFPHRGKIYIPCASYEEMTEWALPVDAIGKYKHAKDILNKEDKSGELTKFLRGGIWRNFQVKYPESEKMRGKMFYISSKIKKLRNVRESVKQEVWRGQCNCPYWHGIFGGIYLPHLRHANYSHLISAERKIEKIIYKNKKWIDVDVVDYDFDGEKEIIISSSTTNLYIDVNNGGTISEIDYKPANYNLANTFSRKKYPQHHDNKSSEKNDSPASIHEKEPQRKELADELYFFDKYQKVNFIDHFLDSNTSANTFIKGEIYPIGFSGEKFSIKSVTRKKDNIKVKLLKHIDGKKILLSKEFTLTKDGNILFTIEIKNENNNLQELWYATEFNFSFLSDKNESKYCLVNFQDEKIYFDKTFLKEKIYLVELVNLQDKFKVEINFPTTSNFWMFPVYTVFLSEDGYEKCYQGTTIIPSWKFTLSPQKSYAVEGKIRILQV